MRNAAFYLLMFSILFSCSNSDDQDTSTEKTVATYSIKFTNVWNEGDHGPLPNNPHWSRLVGANHNSLVTFLESGGIATQGIEDIAENGVNTTFNNEVLESIANGNTEQYIDGSGLNLSNGTTIEINNIEISDDYPLLTLISMIAPSPDWMVFVNGINLRNDNNADWRTSMSIDLFVHDSGTDSGSSYSATDADITPHLPISSLRGVSPFNNEKVATLEITLQNVEILSE